MDHLLDWTVSVKETSVCIVDDTGRIVKEVRQRASLKSLLKVLGTRHRFKRIGLEAGPLSHGFQWACGKQAARGLCRDAAHAGGAEAQIKQDGPQ